MKITSINVWTVVVPAIPGRVHSPEYVPATGWDQVPKQIVRVETDTEYYGIGEAGRGPAIEEAIAGARLLLRRDPEAITLQNIYAAPADGLERKLQVGTGPLYEAYEMAVFDLGGRIRLLPVHALLGGAVRERVRADYWMGHQTPEDGKRAVERALEHGFKGVKIKCKLEEPMFDRLEAMRDVAGPEFKVTVDPNERFYTAEQAIALAAELAPLDNVEVFEDPIPKSDIEGYEMIHGAIPFPLAMHLGAVIPNVSHSTNLDDQYAEDITGGRLEINEGSSPVPCAAVSVVSISWLSTAPYCRIRNACIVVLWGWLYDSSVFCVYQQWGDWTMRSTQKAICLCAIQLL